MATLVKSISKMYRKTVKAVKAEIEDAKELLTPEVKEVAVKTTSVRKTTSKKLSNMARKIDGGALKIAEADVCKQQKVVRDAEAVYYAAKEELDLVVRSTNDAKAKMEAAKDKLKIAQQYAKDVEDGTSIRRAVAGGVKAVADLLK